MNKLKQSQIKTLDTINCKDLRDKIDEIIDFCNETNKRLDFLEDEKIADEAVESIDNLELEDHNFRVNSKGWVKVNIDGEFYLQNPEGNIWEITKGENKGEQLFTFQAMMRETKKAGERVPTDEEFSKLVKTKDDIKNLKYSGYRNTDGTFYYLGTNALFWSSTVSGSNAWHRYLYYTNATVNRYENIQAFGFSVRCLKDKKCDFHKHLDEIDKFENAAKFEKRKHYKACITLDEIWDMLFSSFPPDMENFDTMTDDQAYRLLQTFWKKLEDKTYNN